ncbi:LysR family transcriptional regulator (plasmid) [Bosea sp. F3-2]|uniref:LysR substrate-binding domain-containing protein n=1 Tax=Bosea sp. F3-2 TaxID=2599640 RepID=UPI0011EFE6BA|nr:LysR substrate-binding domain-containing protein [Bosea sp. F3-2]QEL27127.1 LysR family transcriptional regulator [Bosea sp. F3-2]
MHYRQVEIFKAIMDSGSITEAAHILHISQPAVSKALKLLEAELGLRLFDRTTKGIAATEEARLLYTEVERTYFGMQNLARFAASLGHRRQGRIVISTIPALGIAWLPTVVARFSEAYPDATISLQSSNSVDAARLVGSGEIDLGIAQLRSEEYNLSRRKLFDLEGVIALPAGHRLARKLYVEASDLDGETIVALGPEDEFRRKLTQALEGAGQHPRTVIDASLGLTICALVAAGCGVGIVDSEAARMQDGAALVFRSFRPAIYVPIFLFRQRGRPTGRLVEAFSTVLRPPPPFRSRPG